MKLLPLLLFAAALGVATPASAAGDVLAPRYKQTSARIEALFGHRTVDAAKEPIKENPFGIGLATPEGPAAPVADINPGQAVITGDAELLTAGVRALSPMVRGTITRENRPFVTINSTNYGVGEQVVAPLPTGQRVFLKVLEVIPSATSTQRGTVKFGYKDLTVTITL